MAGLDSLAGFVAPEMGRLPRDIVDPTHLEPGTEIARRYTLVHQAGRGGSGVVFRATDRLSGGTVALKLLSLEADEERARVRREVAALRLLRLPGVVRLVDEGTDGDIRFIAMDFIAGEPFPGKGDGPWRWDQLAPTVLAVLETLSRVHAAAVVHRDLKPGNILVDAHGRPTLLDFGLARGDGVGQTITRAGLVLGTPAYLAPEQAFGRRADARADLFALGVMIYEALSGTVPHEAGDVQRMLIARATQRAEALRRVAPDVPQHVSDVVDQLLALSPEDRPATAAITARLLGGADLRTQPGARRPRLGPMTVIDAAVERLLAGRAVAISGRRGSGRTRALDDIVTELVARGRTVRHARPGTRPFSGVVALGAPLDAMAHDDLTTVVAALSRFVRDLLLRGVIVVVDDWELVDRWSAEILADCAERGPVLRATLTPEVDAIALRELTPAELEPLFAGPRRIFHVPEDAAQELWRRTAGLASAIATEVDLWVATGLGRWNGDRLAVERAAIGRLRLGLSAGARAFEGARVGLRTTRAEAADPHTASEIERQRHLSDLLTWLHLAWPHHDVGLLTRVTGWPPWLVESSLRDLERGGALDITADGAVQLRGGAGDRGWSETRRLEAHAALAAALAPGAPGRLYHLVAVGDLDGSGVEARRIASDLAQEGQLDEAAAVLGEALMLVREEGAHPGEGALLEALTKVAHAEGTLTAFARLEYELARARTPLPHLSLFARAAVAVARRGGDETLAQIEAVPPLADVELELARQTTRVRAARSCPVEREETVVADFGAWATATGDDRVVAAYEGALGKLRFRQTRYHEAARHQAAAAAPAAPAAHRVNAMLNGASALMEARRLDEAMDLARRGRAFAEACRHPYYEARAEWLWRNAAYRKEILVEPDHELVELVAQSGVPYLAVLTQVTEGAIAWRAGDVAAAARLSGRAAEGARELGMRWAHESCALWHLATSGQTVGAGRAEAIARSFASCVDDGMALQGLGLLALVAELREPAWSALALARAGNMTPEQLQQRRDILAPAEALDFLTATPRPEAARPFR